MNNKSKGVVKGMNTNQRKVMNKLNDMFCKGEITFNKYREILDVCLAALEEPAQTSEPKQVDLKDLQFYFEDAYSEKLSNFGHNLIYYVNTGILKAKQKDKRLFGMQPSIITFDEMPKETLTDKFKNLVQVKKNAKQEAVNVPLEATIQPTVQGEIKFERLEGAKFIREANEQDAYDAAMKEWRESFDAWKEKDAEIDNRLNEIADKVNAIYAAVNKLKEPVINKANTTINYTGGQLTGEQVNEILVKMKNDLAKSIREDRLKGGFK